MTQLTKASVVGIISFLAVVGFSTPATTYAWGGDSFFFPTSGYSGPREQLVVYAFGPSSAPSYNTMQTGTYQPGYSTTNGQHYPAQYSYAQPSYAMPHNMYTSEDMAFQNYGQFNSKFFNYTPVVVNNMIPQQYTYPQPSYQQYSPQSASAMPWRDGYPSYSGPYGSSYGSYGYSGGYGQSTGMKDFWGNDLCNWGSDYAGYPCDRDPHQWIQDPYTGAWY